MQTSLRMTKQRQVLLEELRKVKSHPTAIELCDMVRRRMPRVSLGTVYRNLEILSRRGDIKKIELGCEEMRFDGNIHPHYHLRCLKCGALEDLRLPVIAGLENQVETMTGATVKGHHLEFVGYCKYCCQA